MEDSVQAVLASINMEIKALESLEGELGFAGSEELLRQVKHLKKCANLINGKVIDHCESAGLSVTPDYSAFGKQPVPPVPVPACTEDPESARETDKKDQAGPLRSGRPEASARVSRQIPLISHMDEELLKTVGRYMKGRLTTKTINEVIDKINTAIQRKYQLMRKAKKQLNPTEKKCVLAFKDQETNATKGCYFCTADDLKEFAQYKVINTSVAIFTVLRHCQLIKEIREPKMPIKYAIVE